VIFDDFEDIGYFLIIAPTRTKHPKFNPKAFSKALVMLFKIAYKNWLQALSLSHRYRKKSGVK